MKANLPLSRFNALFAFSITALVVTACAPKQHAVEELKAYSGEEKNSGEVVSILMLTKDETKDYVVDYIDWVKINQIMIDHKEYGKIKILPGSYFVEWGRVFHMSPLVKFSGKEERTWSANLTFEAGHTYTIHANRSLGPGYRLHSWVTDDTYQKTIWGKPYYPGPYDHLRD